MPLLFGGDREVLSCSFPLVYIMIHTRAPCTFMHTCMFIHTCIYVYSYFSSTHLPGIIHIYSYRCTCIYIYLKYIPGRYIDMGWLRLAGPLKRQVSFAKEPYKTDDILQKRPIIIRSLLIIATPYKCIAEYLLQNIVCFIGLFCKRDL